MQYRWILYGLEVVILPTGVSEYIYTFLIIHTANATVLSLISPKYVTQTCTQNQYWS
mgnify:FL=1